MERKVRLPTSVHVPATDPKSETIIFMIYYIVQLEIAARFNKVENADGL